jgi:hypothetical protein
LERSNQQGVQEEERRQAEQREEQQRQSALREDEDGAMRLRQHENQRQLEENARERREQEEARQDSEARQPGPIVAPEASDPHAVLGVPQGASKEDIAGAYQEARLKYDPTQVTHLSNEVQEHFRAKAEAVELAHQKLTE